MKTLMTLIFVLTVAAASANSFAGVNPDGNKDGKTSSTAMYSGKIVDSFSKEALAGVKISIENTDITAYSDFDGNFEIALPQNTDLSQVKVSYISYEEKTVNLSSANEEIEIKPIH